MTDWFAMAPDGASWICGACGRTGKVRGNMGDTSCVLGAVQTRDGSQEHARHYRITAAGMEALERAKTEGA